MAASELTSHGASASSQGEDSEQVAVLETLLTDRRAVEEWQDSGQPAEGDSGSGVLAEVK